MLQMGCPERLKHGVDISHLGMQGLEMLSCSRNARSSVVLPAARRRIIHLNPNPRHSGLISASGGELMLRRPVTAAAITGFQGVPNSNYLELQHHHSLIEPSPSAAGSPHYNLSFYLSTFPSYYLLAQTEQRPPIDHSDSHDNPSQPPKMSQAHALSDDQVHTPCSSPACPRTSSPRGPRYLD